MFEPVDKDVAGFTANRMRGRYILALGLIALLTVVSQWIVQHSLANQEHDSRVVNIAGRQRMLSQKITKTSLRLRVAERAEDRNLARRELTEALAIWQRSHEGLQHGDPDLGLPGDNSPEIDALFAVIESEYRAMVHAARSIIDLPDDAGDVRDAVAQLIAHEPVFLAGMDSIVFRYDAEAKEKVDFARRLEFGLGALTLIVLALEARFIFAPAVRRLLHDVRRQQIHEADMERLFDASPTAMFLIDETTLTIIRGNHKADLLMGCETGAYVGQPFNDYLDEKFEANRSFLEKIRAGDSLDEYEVVLLDSRRSMVEALASACRVSYADHRRLAIGITDITEIKKAQQTLQYYATFDEMTGLINRRTGLLMLATELDRAGRDHLPLSVCFVDLDGLKVINDRYGHQEGDAMIKLTSAALLESIRGGDVAVRLGGDEFLLILHDCTEPQAAQLVERIELRLGQLLAEERRPYTLSASIGLAVYVPGRHRSPEDLIAEADARMYKVKDARHKPAAEDAAG